ncbi:Uncharacterised protein [Burkholderia pseudomallei]|nr:Uncharacterised protein [Burkholderia pseudomallei]
MLAGRPYHAVTRAFPSASAHGLYVRDVAAMLSTLTGRAWAESHCGRNRVLGCARLPRAACAAIIGRPSWRFGHWVALECGLVHDPDFDRPIELADYPRQHWRVLRLVR